MADPLDQLLKQTGWSYDDILKRLEKYKHNTEGPEQDISQNEKNNDAATTTLNSDNKELTTGSTTESVINCSSCEQEDTMVQLEKKHHGVFTNNNQDDQDHKSKNKDNVVECIASMHPQIIGAPIGSTKSASVTSADVLSKNDGDGRVHKRRRSSALQNVPKFCNLSTNDDSSSKKRKLHSDNLNLSTTSDQISRTDGNSFKIEMKNPLIQDNDILRDNTNISSNSDVSNTSPEAQKHSYALSNFKNETYNHTPLKLKTKSNKLITNLKIYDVTPTLKTAKLKIPKDVETVLNTPDKVDDSSCSSQILDQNVTTNELGLRKSDPLQIKTLVPEDEKPTTPIVKTNDSHKILKSPLKNHNTNDADLRTNKETRKFNTNRLNNITSALLQKLSTVATESGSADNMSVTNAETVESTVAGVAAAADDEQDSGDVGWKIVSVMGGYRSPTPESEIENEPQQSSQEPGESSTTSRKKLKEPKEKKTKVRKNVKKLPGLKKITSKLNKKGVGASQLKFARKSVLKPKKSTGIAKITERNVLDATHNTPPLSIVASKSYSEIVKEKSVEEDQNVDGKVISPTKILKVQSSYAKTDRISQVKSPVHESVIKPTKTKDVTKIKGWKKKKFALESLEEKIVSKDLSRLYYIPEAGASRLASKDLLSSESSQSAFSSEILDQYLTKNTDLNISYKVPVLDAERALDQTYIDIQFPNYSQEVLQSSDLEIKKDSSKPKTLAEKRKMEECQVPHVEEYMNNMDSTQRQQYIEAILKLKKKLIDESIPFTRRCFMTSSNVTNTDSVVLYNGKRIKVSSTKSNQVLARIKFKDEPKKSNVVLKLEPPRKPSLLNCLTQKRIAYKSDEWEPAKVKLPKVYLEVVPKIGKRIHPSIEHLIKRNDTILTEQQVNFALSTLQTKATTDKFVFPVTFANNQKTMLMQRRIPRNINSTDAPKTVIEESDDVIANAVKKVVGKLLDYIEIQEETNDISQYDDDEIGEPKLHNAEVKQTSLELTSKLANKRESDALRKAAKEMKRLSCKVVSVLTDDENLSNGPCAKEYCLMGCICKSIEGNLSNLLQSHCELPKCMFKCRCNKKRFSFQDIFSEDAISRLQDEATKNLAKVEKEFTQTIIQTNNRFIVVSDSNERKKRTPKLPKKYDDFVEDDLFEQMPPKTDTVNLLQTPSGICNRFFQPCHVKLPKYDFKHIIPYCMIHSLYKCHCRNKSRSGGKIVVRNNITPQKVTASSDPSLEAPETIQNVPKTIKRRTKAILNELENFTSRTRGVPTSMYSIRNKTDLHRKNIMKSSNILEQKLQKYLKENAGDIMKGVVDEDSNGNDLFPTVDVKHVRKQKLNILSDVNENENNTQLDNNTHKYLPLVNFSSIREINPRKELKLQRRRRRKTNGKDLGGLQKKEAASDYSVLETEKKFLQFLSKHNSQIRILPWSTLASRYETGSLQLWFLNSKDSSTVMLTENGIRPSVNHANVKLFEHLINPIASPNNIVLYLVNKEIPLGKPKDQVLVLLLETVKDVWRICALCDKNKCKRNTNLSISIIEFYGDIDDILKETGKVVVSHNEEPLNLFVSPDKVNDSHKQIPLTTIKPSIITRKKGFVQKQLLPDTIHKDVLNMEAAIWAGVPNITFTCKWRVISIKTQFARLSFSRCEYSVAYDDILNVHKEAVRNKITIAMASKELSTYYPHRQFGIYCDHNSSDTIFIGPYFAHESYDFTLLVFLNNILVESSYSDDDPTKTPRKGYWYRQAAHLAEQNDDDVQFVPEQTTLIDLTYESDTEQTVMEESDTLSSAKSVTALDDDSSAAVSDSSVVSDKLEMQPRSNVRYICKTNSSAKLAKEKLPRFIVTNVPNLGYITAYLYGNLLDVTCPISKKPKTFTHWPTALSTLLRLLASRFIPISTGFKLEVRMVESIDEEEYKPLDSKFLNGSYVIGEFGVKHILSITRENFVSYGLSANEIVRMQQLQECKHLHFVLLKLSKQLDIDVPKESSSSLHVISTVADTMFREIVDLKANNQKYEDEKVALEHVKKTYVEKRSKLLAERIKDKDAIQSITSVFKLPASVKNISREALQKTETRNCEPEKPNIGSNNNKGLFWPLLSSSNNRVPIHNLKITRKPPNSTSNSSLLSIKDTSASTNAIQTKTVILQKVDCKQINSNESKSDTKSTNNQSVKLLNNVILKPVSNKQAGKTSDTSKQVFNTVPMLSKIVIPTTQMPITSTPGNNLKTVAASASSGISTVKVGKSTYLTDTAMQNILIKYKPDPNTPNNTMATLTPLPKKVYMRNCSRKQKYIRVLQGDKLKYVQVVSEPQRIPVKPATSLIKAPLK